MADVQLFENIDLREAITTWLEHFESSIGEKNIDSAANLFVKDGQWRDLLAFTWHVQTMNGIDEIRDTIRRTIPSIAPKAFTLAKKRTPPRIINRGDIDCIEAFIEFDTNTGPASGVLRLVTDSEGPMGLKAWVLMTSLDEIRGHEEAIGDRRPSGENYSRSFGGNNWLDLRNKARLYEEREPAVLIVGAGQSGLTLAARLGVLGLDTLLIDKHERVGDNWRKRYHSLVLHNEVYINHMPYMPFPPNWPVFIPKDKIANWFESYAEAMELNVWMNTSLVSGSYDETNGHWQIVVKNSDGAERVLRPRHVVFSTGVSAIPVRPNLPGLDNFEGEIIHSGEYLDGHKWAGKKAVVLGTGNSGHDVTQDLHSCGVEVNIIQRSSTHIVSLREAQKVYAHYFEGPPIEDNDLLAVSLPYPVLVKSYQKSTRSMLANDKDLLDGLKSRGFRLNNGGDDSTGFQMSYLRRGGGYCFNVGCSDLIISGEVGLIHFSEIDSFVPQGIRMQDGSIIEADLLVTATGYKNQQDTTRLFLGDKIADRIGKVWGFDEGGELRNMWRRTAQPGLWFMAGGLAQVRIFSKYLALQIKAVEEGIIGAKIACPERAPMADAAD
ncbi:MAG: monooxygenase [Rhodospirillaceae bacterium]|nr:monooxygenase [Rhodospirillaceae bacterium]